MDEVDFTACQRAIDTLRQELGKLTIADPRGSHTALQVHERSLEAIEGHLHFELEHRIREASLRPASATMLFTHDGPVPEGFTRTVTDLGDGWLNVHLTSGGIEPE